jgi:hypothetical protein
VCYRAVYMLWSGEKYLSSAGNRTPSVQLVIHCYKDRAVPSPTAGSTYTKHCAISTHQHSQVMTSKGILKKNPVFIVIS